MRPAPALVAASTPRRRRRPLPPVITLLMALLLAGCTGTPLPDLWEGDRTQPDLFELEPVDVAAELQGGPTPVGTSVLPPQGELPGVLAVRQSSGERAPWVQLWSLEGASAAEAGVPDLGVDVDRVEVAGDEEVAALFTVSHDNGGLVPRLHLSEDRRSWRAVEVPEELADHALKHLAVVEGTTLAVLQGADLGEDLLVVDAAGEARVSPLPPTTDLRRPSDWLLAGHGGELVLLREEAVPAQPVAWYTYRSGDGGRSWEAEGETVEDDPSASFTSFGWFGEEYLASGRGSVDGADTAAAAWSSPGAADWRAEEVPAPESVLGLEPADSSLGSIVSSGEDEAVAIYGCACTGVRWAERDAGGSWRVGEAESGQVDTVGTSGVAWLDDDAPVGVVQVDTGVVLVGDATVEPVVEAPRPTYVSDAVSLGETTGISTATPYLELSDGGGYRRGSRYSGQVYDGAAIAAGEWPVPELAEQRVLSTESAPGEASLVLGVVDSDRGIDVEGQFFDGEEYRPVSGFLDSRDYQYAIAALQTPDGWLAATQEGSLRSDQSSRRSAQLYRSEDGVDWSRERGAFKRSGSHGSSVSGLCLDRDGEPVAVGWVQDEEGVANAASWRRVDERWERRDLTLDGSSSFDGCVAAADGSLILYGDSRGEATTWRSEDGSGFTPVDSTDERVQKDSYVAVPGGLVAGGSWIGEDYRGPVVWLSTDGEEWVAQPVPAPSGSDDVDVYPVGGELLVVATGVARTTAWRIPDIAEVMSGI